MEVHVSGDWQPALFFTARWAGHADGRERLKWKGCDWGSRRRWSLTGREKVIHLFLERVQPLPEVLTFA